MISFNDLRLPQVLEKALGEMRFKEPTQIQAKAIPVILSHRDMIASAPKGAGKTASFCIPILTRLLKTQQKLSLILVPNRKLGTQVMSSIQQLGKYAPEVRSVLLVEGKSISQQQNEIEKKPRILIATPGRLVEHLREGSFSLSTVEILVLDEADLMLKMDQVQELNEVLRFLPKSRQTVLFSESVSAEMDKLVLKFLKDPVRVSLEESAPAVSPTVPLVVETTVAKKAGALLEQIEKRKGSILVFARTSARAERISKFLTDAGYATTQLHEGQSEREQKAALLGFKKGTFRILVASSEGGPLLDKISEVPHVFHYDLPPQVKDYVHRFVKPGSKGETVSFLTPQDRSKWKTILNLLQ